MRIGRRDVLTTAMYAATGACLAALGGYVYCTNVEPSWLEVEHVTVPLRLPTGLEGLRVAQLGDLHLYPFTPLRLVRRAVDMVNELGPDLVLLTGDYVTGGYVNDSAEAISDLAPVLAGLDPTYGVYAILGNHDLWTDATTIRRGLEKQGIPVLVNQARTIQVGRELLAVAGLDDAWSGTPNLISALEGVPDGPPVILMMHEPDVADRLALDGRVSLQLSGHSHGGQVRLPGRGAPVLPYLGRKYDQGLYRVGHMWLYTTRGIGVVAPPVRLNCRPEVTLITLVGGDGQGG